MQRREFIALLGGAVAVSWPPAARAQQRVKVRTIGFLYPGTQSAAPRRITALLAGLRSGGFRSPEDVEILERIADGDPARLAPMAADLAVRRVDLIVAVSPLAVRAARAVTTTIPIVANDLESDPVAAGFVAGITRPGGNITGVFLDFPNFSQKWLEVLKETVPGIAKVAVFWDPAVGDAQLKAAEAAAITLGIKIETFEVRGRPQSEAAFLAAAERNVDALLILPSPFVGASTKILADLSIARRLPAVTLFTDFARDGGLLAYGPNLLAFFRQTGVVAAKVLRGANPAEMPIETPTKFEFVLNLKTAILLDITVPPTVLLRADEVIE